MRPTGLKMHETVYVIPAIHSYVHAQRNPLCSRHFDIKGRLKCYMDDLQVKFAEVGCEATNGVIENFICAIVFDKQVYCADPFGMRAVALFLSDWEIPWALVQVERKLCTWFPKDLKNLAQKVVKVHYLDGDVRYFDRCSATAVAKDSSSFWNIFTSVVIFTLFLFFF